MSLIKVFISGFLIVGLTACTSSSSKNNADLDLGDSQSDRAAPTGKSSDSGVNPDLAQDTMTDDLEGELNSAATENSSSNQKDAMINGAAPAPVSDDLAAELNGTGQTEALAPPVASGEASVAAPNAATDAASPAIDSTLNSPGNSPGNLSVEPPKLSDDLNAAPPEPAAPETAALKVANEAPPANNSGGSSASTVEIRNIRYVATKNGGTVVVETSAPATYRTREVTAQNQFVVEIANANLPAKLKRPFLTKDFNQTIASIDAYEEPGSNTARVVVQFRNPSSARVRQDGSTLTVAAASAGADSDSLNAQEENEGNQSISGKQPLAEGTDSATNSPTQFYGKPISIEVRETNIRDVMNLIAEQSGANIIVADTVSGNVTLKLRQVPWDQALLLIMKSKNLGYVRQGNVLRIAPSEQLQKEADDVRKIADAKLLAEPLRVRVIPVGYAKVDELKGQVASFLSSRGKVVSDIRTTSLIVTDVVENLDRITNLIKALDTPPLQVLIEGKIVEATDTFEREFGINWGATGQSISTGSNTTLNPSFNILPSPTSNAGAGGIFNVNYGTLNILGSLTAKLNLYETRDIAKVLSSPRVVTMNNLPATIKQIHQIALGSTTISSGASTSSTTYKSIELSLAVTPQITSTSDVLLDVNVKREFIAAANANSATPPVESREAKTNVMVRSGQTAVIGGIYQNDGAVTETGVPGLKDIPVVGWLFKGHVEANTKNELLIFLTPRILKGSRAEADTIKE